MWGIAAHMPAPVSAWPQRCPGGPVRVTGLLQQSSSLLCPPSPDCLLLEVQGPCQASSGHTRSLGKSGSHQGCLVPGDSRTWQGQPEALLAFASLGCEGEVES